MVKMSLYFFSSSAIWWETWTQIDLRSSLVGSSSGPKPCDGLAPRLLSESDVVEAPESVGTTQRLAWRLVDACDLLGLLGIPRSRCVCSLRAGRGAVGLG